MVKFLSVGLATGKRAQKSSGEATWRLQFSQKRLLESSKPDGK
jgi:hypothetical protein